FDPAAVHIVGINVITRDEHEAGGAILGQRARRASADSAQADEAARLRLTAVPLAAPPVRAVAEQFEPGDRLAPRVERGRDSGGCDYLRSQAHDTCQPPQRFRDLHKPAPLYHSDVLPAPASEWLVSVLRIAARFRIRAAARSPNHSLLTAGTERKSCGG